MTARQSCKVLIESFPIFSNIFHINLKSEIFQSFQDQELSGVLHHRGVLYIRLHLADHRPGLGLPRQGRDLGGRPHLPLLPHPGVRGLRRRQGLPERSLLSKERSQADQQAAAA